MSLIDQIALYKNRMRGEVARLPVPTDQKRSLFLWPEFRLDRPLRWRVGDFQNYVREGFETNALIYSCIMYKVRAQQSAPLRAYKGDYEHPDLLPESHPLAKLVSRPNPHQSWSEFQGQNTAYLNIRGDVFIYLERPKRGGLPEAMYSLRPDRVFIIPQRKERAPLGYLYVREGEMPSQGLPILPEDMIHVKLPNPLDPLEGMGYGLSPLAPLAYSADVDNNATKFLREFFLNGALFTGLLRFDTALDEGEVQRIKARWKEQYGGFENWSDVGVLDSGGSYERMSMTFQEMGFGTLDERNESRILGPLGVPAILINTRYGLARSTYANYEQAKEQFWQDTFLPEMSLYETDYRYYLQGESGEFVGFDYSKIAVLQESKNEKVVAWATLVDRGVPKATAAEVMGLDMPDLPDGDVVYMPFNMVAMGQTGQGTQPRGDVGAVEAEEQAEEASKGAILGRPFGSRVGIPNRSVLGGR